MEKTAALAETLTRSPAEARDQGCRRPMRHALATTQTVASPTRLPVFICAEIPRAGS